MEALIGNLDWLNFCLANSIHWTLIQVDGEYTVTGIGYLTFFTKSLGRQTDFQCDNLLYKEKLPCRQM